MAGWDEISFHSKRAMAELDLAVRASSFEAARAHFGLSSLHLDRMRKLSRPTTTPPKRVPRLA
jgi:hypothetical protein